MQTLLDTAHCRLTLYRYPRQNQDPLQAWDAADEYLINELAESQQAPDGPVIIMNDGFGALAAFLHAHAPVCVTDSHVSERATLANLAENGLDPDAIRLQDALAPLPDAPALVVIKVSKYQALLEQQLLALRQVVTPATRILAAGKAKDIHTSTLKLFEKYLGETRTSLAWKKARLIHCTPAAERPPLPNPFPTVWPLEGSGMLIHNHANVFSRTSLDIGARFMLDNLPTHSARRVIDLGCGNGVLGLSLLAKDSEVEVTFIDESYMAVASARLNVEHNLPDALPRARFLVNNCLDDVPAGAADRILCNPPFHQLQAITDHIAWQMFSDAHRVLPQGGELWIVGNRHLDYHNKLKRLFGNAQVVASNSKFVILKAIKR
ncbi:methyltransferase [Aeromonas caviae]|uniref:Ribosomal RNA large subunit methyltransferase G n=1 Tax=Aeromonas caviae TaxID=648 RepID=A0AAV4YIG1_AERCA|nr:methyltransferase [Aeromonas caviae]BCM76781.1 ribosomal RNA large subunit methyltransferase G [Aeromonas caviae]GJA30793.1 ribosomal RNA large subunit methyltransferase G [Aeromonas caviae]GJA35269.1 ribosomal RNA large subunit methyltransferase G [Aeromonas caviae]GJA39916.1 ribosomal RNA large subunit methyltransferase G [Aeromonas caviae]GJA48910.1 ribosomal RNA large subunit methyltransferase G [Aeromonas caviae]